MKKFIILTLFSILALGLVNYANAQDLAPIPGVGEIKDSGPTATSRCLAQSPSECCLPTIDFDRPACQAALAGQIVPTKKYGNPIVQKGYTFVVNCLNSGKTPDQCFSDSQPIGKEITNEWLACRNSCGDAMTGDEISGYSGEYHGACSDACDNKWPDSLHDEFKQAIKDAIADQQAAKAKAAPKPQIKETPLPKSVKEEKVSLQEKVIPKPKTKEVPSPVQPQVQRVTPEPKAETALSPTPSAEPKPSRFKLIETFYVKFTSPLKDFFRKVFRFGGRD